VTDRAWEVLKAAESQYSKATCRIEEHSVSPVQGITVIARKV